MNHNILRTSILVLGLAVGIASTAQEARRMHPRQKELTREVSHRQKACLPHEYAELKANCQCL